MTFFMQEHCIKPNNKHQTAQKQYGKNKSITYKKKRRQERKKEED